jgi:hypothetical protein
VLVGVLVGVFVGVFDGELVGLCVGDRVVGAFVGGGVGQGVGGLLFCVVTSAAEQLPTTSNSLSRVSVAPSTLPPVLS